MIPIASVDDRRIFLSYARTDGCTFASRLYRDLKAAGHTPWLDEDYLRLGSNWVAEVEAGIDQCDLLIAILTRAYILSEICRAEHMRALRQGKVVIPILLEEEADRPLALEHLQFQNFTDAGRYTESLQDLIAALGSSKSTTNLPHKFQSTFVNAPPLPHGYVYRAKELDELKTAVIAQNSRRQVALTALQGMGGIGKSVLAAALCHDALIQAAFPDGVIWVSIGRTPGNLVSQMRSIGSVFGDRPEHYETTETGGARLRNLLRGKAVLLVLDDIWERHHIEPFLTDELRSRILFTSRDRTIALDLGATEIRLGALTTEQAISVLREWTGRSDPSFNEIAQCTWHLPLALKLAGARVKEGMSPAEWLQRYRSSPLQVKLGYRLRSPKDDLTTCFDLSLDRYEASDRELYYALGIFPEDLRIPFAIVLRLWRELKRNLEEERCHEVIADFARMELLDLDAAGNIALHDLMQEYALVKLNGSRRSTHCRLLDSYAKPGGEWWDIENDGYFFRYAAHHFVGGQRAEQLQELVFNFRWLDAKLRATEPAALIEDFRAVPSSGDAHLVESAIRLSAHVLARDSQQLAAQLTGRLLGHPSGTIKRLLSDAARYATREWLRPLDRSMRGAGSSLVWTLLGHEAGVSSVLITPDDTAAISASFDGTIKIWDWRRGIEIRTLIGHGRQVNSLAITADGRSLVSGSSDHTVKVWDLESGTVTRTLLAAHSPIVHVDLKDSTQLVSTSRDGTTYR